MTVCPRCGRGYSKSELINKIISLFKKDSIYTGAVIEFAIKNNLDVKYDLNEEEKKLMDKVNKAIDIVLKEDNFEEKEIVWLCKECGEKMYHRRPGVATWHMDKCDSCKQKTMVTEPRDFRMGEQI